LIEALDGTHNAHTAVLFLIIDVLDDEPQGTFYVVVGTEIAVYLRHFPETLREVHTAFLQNVAERLIGSSFKAGWSSSKV
jgi:hypothetical protein